MNQEGTHSFSETSSIHSCHALEFPGESHCFTLEKENFVPSTSGEECVDLFFSSEVNLNRFNKKFVSAVQLSLNQYGFIDSVTPYQKAILIHPDPLLIPDKVLLMQRVVVLLI